MAYAVLLKRSAEKELEALPAAPYQRLLKRLLALEKNPRPVGVKKLQGEEGYRLRVGNYRILYTIDDTRKQVDIVSVGHRRQVYR